MTKKVDLYLKKLAISTFDRNDPRANSKEARKVRAVVIDFAILPKALQYPFFIQKP